MCCSSILHLVVTNKGNHLLITLCLVCSTIMVKFYEKLWLLKKITNYWHLNFLLLIAPKRGWHLWNRFWTHQIPTSCLPTLLIFIHIEHICSFFVAFFSATIDGRHLIFGHKLHKGAPYRGKRFWTYQIPTSCLPILLIFIHYEHTFCICSFLVAFFSATIDGRNLIFGCKLHRGTPYRGKRFWTRHIPTSCLPKSGGIISEH